jgi:hypothetical protein
MGGIFGRIVRTGGVVVWIVRVIGVGWDASDITVFCRLSVVTGTRYLRDWMVVGVVGVRARVGL